MKEQLKAKWLHIEEELHLIPEPHYLFEVGDLVHVGSLKDVVIKEVLLNGKVYLIEYTEVTRNSGIVTETPNSLDYVKWIRVSNRGGKVNELNFSQKDDLQIHFSQMTIQSLFTKVYSFGVNFDPVYQRGYVWDMSDKIALLDSIFMNVEVGKFAFVQYNDEQWAKLNLSYEALDGKQRLSTLCEFYEGRFEYNGFKYNELSFADRKHFLTYPVSIAEIRDATEEQILRYFIKLNSHGKIMDNEHLEKVKEMLLLSQAN